MSINSPQHILHISIFTGLICGLFICGLFICGSIINLLHSGQLDEYIRNMGKHSVQILWLHGKKINCSSFFSSKQIKHYSIYFTSKKSA